MGINKLLDNYYLDEEEFRKLFLAAKMNRKIIKKISPPNPRKMAGLLLILVDTRPKFFPTYTSQTEDEIIEYIKLNADAVANLLRELGEQTVTDKNLISLARKVSIL